MQLELVLEFQKQTKNKYVYGVEDGEDGPITSLYISKDALGPKPPESIRVVVEDL